MKKLCRAVQCWKFAFPYTFVFVYLLCVTGCGPALSSVEQVREFEKAGPITPEVDLDDSGRVKNRAGPYRVVPGDLLELQIPGTLRIISSNLSGSLQKVEPYLCRISDAGTITLPIVGEIPVVGKNIAEIESSIIDAYFPKYVVNRPMVVCKVAEYQSENESVFTVMGLVNRPSNFPYPPDTQYNLIEVLAFAGGLNLVADPRYVKIYRQDTTGDVVSATFRIDNKYLINAYNIMIKPGDVIYVDHTLRTRTNTLLSNIFYIRAGVDVDTR